MKTFEQLTYTEKESARARATDSLLGAIIEGRVRFNDRENKDGFQAAIDAAIEDAEKMQTPWFAGEYIMGARFKPCRGHIRETDGLWPVREWLQSMAWNDAEDALYPEPGEHVVPGIAGAAAVEAGKAETVHA